MLNGNRKLQKQNIHYEPSFTNFIYNVYIHTHTNIYTYIWKFGEIFANKL